MSWWGRIPISNTSELTTKQNAWLLLRGMSLKYNYHYTYNVSVQKMKPLGETSISRGCISLLLCGNEDIQPEHNLMRCLMGL